MVACPGRALAVRPSYCPVMFRANNGPSRPKNRKRSFCRELVENRKNSFDPGRQTRPDASLASPRPSVASRRPRRTTRARPRARAGGRAAREPPASAKKLPPLRIELRTS
jgi:hypothetical protein